MNFKTLLTKDNKNFIFSSKQFKKLCKENKKSLKETQEEIAKVCFVSYETVRKWYRGNNGPNDYKHIETLAAYFKINEALLLEEKKINDKTQILFLPKKQGMNGIDYNTIILIEILNELASKSKHGFIPFSNVESMNEAKIIYDDCEIEADSHHIVLDYLIDECHHDIISTYESYINEFTSGIKARVITDEDSSTYAEIRTVRGDFVIEDGKWYFAS